jgi:lipoprotein signal peptidase
MTGAPSRGNARRRALGALMALAVLAIDQASKAWILYGLDLPRKGSVPVLPVLNFTMVWNHGVTFGILAGDDARLLLIAVAIAAIAGLSVWLWRTPSLLTALGLGAIIGGAAGNVISRIAYGAVVDFVDVHLGNLHWYVFNLADAAIDGGVAALIIESLFSRDRAGHLPPPAREDKEAP